MKYSRTEHIQHCHCICARTEHMQHCHCFCGRTEHIQHCNFFCDRTEHIQHCHCFCGRTEHIQHCHCFCPYRFIDSRLLKGVIYLKSLSSSVFHLPSPLANYFTMMDVTLCRWCMAEKHLDKVPVSTLSVSIIVHIMVHIANKQNSQDLWGHMHNMEIVWSNL